MTDPMTTTRDGDVLNTDGLANIEHTLDTHVKYHAKVDTEWARMVAMQVIQSHRALQQRLDAAERRAEERTDWTGDDVEDAVDRIRAASQSDDATVAVNPVDLRMLFASADGVAESYSILLEHMTGLTKPTTDPHMACVMSDDRITEIVEIEVKERIAALTEQERNDA